MTDLETQLEQLQRENARLQAELREALEEKRDAGIAEMELMEQLDVANLQLQGAREALEAIRLNEIEVNDLTDYPNTSTESHNLAVNALSTLSNTAKADAMLKVVEAAIKTSKRKRPYYWDLSDLGNAVKALQAQEQVEGEGKYIK